jgi:hypothetical protein
LSRAGLVVSYVVLVLWVAHREEEVKKAQIKARLLTGTYLLQSDMQRFSKEKDEQKCELCQIEQENMEHFLLRCPALNEKRKITLSKLKQTLIQSTYILQ